MDPELWALDLDQGPIEWAAWAALLPLVSAERRARALRLRDPLKARQTLGAELMLRSALVRRLGEQALRVTLREDAHGKPALAERPDVRFNLSHGGRYVCLAVAGEPVGVDVEEIRPLDVGALRSWLAAGERDWIDAAPGEGARLRRLFAVWTRKESVAKAIGRGHGMPFASFSTVSRPQAGSKLRPVVLGWHLAGGRLPGGYLFAAAKQSPAPWPRPKVLSAARLLACLALVAVRGAGGAMPDWPGKL